MVGIANTMASPLAKRLPRDLRHNIGKYLGLFCLMLIAIALECGFLSAVRSIQQLTDTMRQDYAIEDARLVTYKPLAQDVVADIENGNEDADASEDSYTCKLSEDFRYDLEATLPSGKQVTIRLYTGRDSFNIPAYAEGRVPSGSAEIALDRVFCSNNGLHIGDTVTIRGAQFALCGILTMPDYQALFVNNSDFLFNAQSFSVALVDKAVFDGLEEDGISPTYDYALHFDDRELSQRGRTVGYRYVQTALDDADVNYEELLDCEDNQGIGYASEDMESDSTMWIVLMLLLVAIMAFVFVVLNGATLEAESSAIGTLLALGYTRKELLGHYLVLPIVVGVCAAVLGNAIGYTLMSAPMQGLYYNSYSLPPYVASFHADVLFLTTILPLVVLIVVNWRGLAKRLGHTPLQFLRHETRTASSKAQRNLPKRWKFISRFRVRVLLGNLSNFAILFLGIMFSSLLLVFGLCMMPTVDHYAQSMADDLVSEHLYLLSEPVELAEPPDGNDNEVNTLSNSEQARAQAEKLALCTVQIERPSGGFEDIKVYGISEDTRYWNELELGNRVLMGNGLALKFGFAPGKPLTVQDPHTDWTFALTPVGTMGSSGCMDVYMGIDRFRTLFMTGEDYFNAYASDMPLAIDSKYLVNDMTPASMMAVSEQLTDSFGDMIGFVVGLAVAIYIILMYLLTKTVIDRSARSISYMKVFGYHNREVNSLYLHPISASVLVSLVASLPMVIGLIIVFMKAAFMRFTGNIEAYTAPEQLAYVLLAGVVSYALIAVLHVWRIRKVPLSLALKDNE